MMASVETGKRLDQVETYLIEYIKNRKLHPGSRLPSEAEMAKIIGVSRNTIREAYISLEARGYINRRHGMGTFVTRAPIVEDSLTSSGFNTFPSFIKSAGYIPDYRLISIEHDEAPIEVNKALNLPTSEKLLCIERIILADDIPAIYIKDYFISEIRKEDFKWDEFNGDMLEFIARNTGFDLGHLHTNYSATVIDKDIASLLQLPEGLPVILSRTTVYTFDNVPITYSIIYFNPNIYQIDTVRVIHVKPQAG